MTEEERLKLVGLYKQIKAISAKTIKMTVENVLLRKERQIRAHQKSNFHAVRESLI